MATQDDVVRPGEIDHIECKRLGAVIAHVSKGDRQSNPPIEWVWAALELVASEPNPSNVLWYMRLRSLPPSMKALVSRVVLTNGLTMRGNLPSLGILSRRFRTKSAVAAVTFCLTLAKVGRGAPLWLMVVVTALARAQTFVKSMVATHSVRSTSLPQCSLVSWASKVACTPTSSSWCWAARCLASICRAQIHACCSS
jgi:hypothetical protein